MSNIANEKHSDVFALGRFCAARAHLYHALLNFKNCLKIHLQKALHRVQERNKSNNIESDENDDIEDVLTSDLLESLARKQERLINLADKYRDADSSSRSSWGAPLSESGGLDHELYQCCYSLAK